MFIANASYLKWTNGHFWGDCKSFSLMVIILTATASQLNKLSEKEFLREFSQMLIIYAINSSYLTKVSYIERISERRKISHLQKRFLNTYNFITNACFLPNVC